MAFDLILYIGLILLCAYCSYTDLTKGIIANKTLVILGGVLLFFNITMNVMRYNKIEWFLYAIYIISAIVIGLILYKYKIWAGGDFKLFTIISFALPYTYVVSKKMFLSTLISTILSSMVIGYVFVLVETLVNLLTKERKVCFEHVFGKTIEQIKKYIHIYFVAVCVNVLIEAILNEIGIVSYEIIIIISILIILTLIRYDLYRKPFVVLPTVIIIIGILLKESELLLNVRTLIIWTLVAAMALLRHLCNQYNYKTIVAEELKPGMILSTQTSIILAKQKTCKYKKVSDESLGSRLSEEDVKLIKNFYEDKENLYEICIVKKIPLALAITLGLLATTIGETMIWL